MNSGSIIKWGDGTRVVCDVGNGVELDGRIVSSFFAFNVLYYTVELVSSRGSNFSLHKDAEKLCDIVMLVVHSSRLRVSRKEKDNG